jgi:hypothetical protein
VPPGNARKEQINKRKLPYKSTTKKKKKKRKKTRSHSPVSAAFCWYPKLQPNACLRGENESVEQCRACAAQLQQPRGMRRIAATDAQQRAALAGTSTR